MSAARARGLCRASSIASPRWALSLALGLVLVVVLVEAALAAPHFPSGLPPRWCGTERAFDFKPGWFPQNRPQVKVVYAYPTNLAGDFQKWSDLIQKDVKSSLEMVGDESGGTRSIAFDLGTECGPRFVDIASIPLKHDSLHYQDLLGDSPKEGGRSAEIQKEVRKALGLDPGLRDRMEGGIRNFAVHVNLGTIFRNPDPRARGDMPGCPKGGRDPSCRPDDRPGPDNIANLGGYWTWTWDPLDTPRMRLVTLHEITHNLGAVQPSAPHSDRAAHCTDGRDVMCGGGEMNPPPCRVQAYDCNKDDYFNANPPPGSYLAAHWNVANSVFTCPYYSSPSERGCAPQNAGADFNGDGRADLAVGVPDEDIGTITNAGAVNVLYGSFGAGAPPFGGLSSSGDQFWHQDSVGVADFAESGDRFGDPLAAADFNGDGFADLAVGLPGEDVGTLANAGAVNVLYGSAVGLSGSGGQIWTQDSIGVDAAETGDRFGAALAAGDFDGDGVADLAVGVRGEDVGDMADAGAVTVVYGGRVSGLSTIGNQFWPQGMEGGGDLADAEAGDRFGSALATGDFDGDGFADLAVGAPLEDVGATSDAGNVNVLYGSASRLSNTRQQLWHQGNVHTDAAETGDIFGDALAAGDFDGDRADDLAVGVPVEDVGTVADAGAVNVIFGGRPAGLSAAGNQFLHQDSPGVPDDPDVSDGFGSALAAADFGTDTRADLAMGVPFEDVGTVGDAGATVVIHGGASGFAEGGDQFWHQDSPGVLDDAEAGDLFGAALAAGDFNGGGAAHLAVGVPLEDQVPPRAAESGGAANVLYGAAPGLNVAGTQFWHQNRLGILDSAEPGDEFGGALAP